MSLAVDFTNQNEKTRQSFIDWVDSRQPRRKPAKQNIPQEVLDRFAEAWNNG